MNALKYTALTLLLILVALFAIGISAEVDPPPTSTPLPIVEALPTETLVHILPTPQPTATATPKPLTPEEMVIEVLVEEVGGRPSRFTAEFNEVGNLLITFKVSDNFSQNMIVQGTQVDAKNVIETIASLDVEYDTLMVTAWTDLLIDEYGNDVDYLEAVWVKYNKDTVDKINWSKFQTKNIYRIADEGDAHPLFRLQG